jgi:hypothetical protein
MKITDIKSQVKNPTATFAAAVMILFIAATTLLGDFVISQPVHIVLQSVCAVLWLALTAFTVKVLNGFITKINK